MQLTYNNIKYTVVLDCDLTVYLLNNSYTYTHTRARAVWRETEVFIVKPDDKVINQH